MKTIILEDNEFKNLEYLIDCASGEGWHPIESLAEKLRKAGMKGEDWRSSFEEANESFKPKLLKEKHD